SGNATFAYPRTWRPIRTDPGTASVALLGHGRSIRGYLNLTPRQGAETLANWPSFRIEHLGDDGSTDVRLIASAHGLAFRSGRGRGNAGARVARWAAIPSRGETTVKRESEPPPTVERGQVVLAGSRRVGKSGCRNARWSRSPRSGCTAIVSEQTNRRELKTMS